MPSPTPSVPRRQQRLPQLRLPPQHPLQHRGWPCQSPIPIPLPCGRTTRSVSGTKRRRSCGAIGSLARTDRGPPGDAIRRLGSTRRHSRSSRMDRRDAITPTETTGRCADMRGAEWDTSIFERAVRREAHFRATAATVSEIGGYGCRLIIESRRRMRHRQEWAHVGPLPMTPTLDCSRKRTCRQ